MIRTGENYMYLHGKKYEIEDYVVKIYDIRDILYFYTSKNYIKMYFNRYKIPFDMQKEIVSFLGYTLRLPKWSLK